MDKRDTDNYGMDDESATSTRADCARLAPCKLSI